MGNYTENDYALCSRFKSEKKKKRLVKEDFEKKLRQNYKQRKQLFHAVWNAPPVPLDKPYQKGWVRFFVLRADVSVSPHADFFMNLLEKINTYQYSSDKSFAIRKRKLGKKISVPSEQFLKKISISDWNCKKIDLTEKEKSYFTLTKEWSNNLGRYIIYYRFDEPWRFVLRVRPNIITHTKPVDSELQSELRILENYITNQNLSYKINRLVMGYARCPGYYQTENPRELNPIKNKSRHLLYQQYVDEMI
jgi:hypothetical protein